MKKQFAIIGLGSFGEAVAGELMRLGHSVLGVESDEHTANLVADRLTQTIIADATDERVLSELSLEHYDAVLVAIGENIEASILATLLVKESGARQVWVKAITTHHHRIVERLGADRVIHPELEMGIRVAQTLTHPNMLDYISLGDDYFVVELRPGEHRDGDKLGELAIEQSAEFRLLGIKHGKELLFDPPDEYQLRRNDHLLLLGQLEALREFSQSLAEDE